MNPLELKEIVNKTKKLNILYVEDNPELRAQTEKFFSNFFENIDIAVDGKDGLVKYKAKGDNYYDLVLSDIYMPHMSGTQMAQEILKINDNQCIVMISAYNNSKQLEELISIGISQFIHKPIKIDAFITAIKKALQSIEKVSKNTEEFNEIENLNQELDSMVQHIDKYVIASRTDLKGKITYVSKAYEIISGYSEAEMLGKSHNIVRHPDMPSSVFKDMWDTIKSGKLWVGDVKNLKKDGSYYWVRANVAPYYNSLGEHIGYSAIRYDITSQKEVERLKEEMEEINRDLEQQVMARIGEVYKLNEEIKETQKEIVLTMGAIGESRSKETGNHVKRVAEYSKLLALYSGLDPAEAEMLKEASPMHDIGKIAIPDNILNKPGRLDDQERAVMDTHALLGYEMLHKSQRPLLKMAATVAYEHHERWDGKGYPQGLKGEQISIYGRITAVADVFDALGSHRCYKEAWEDQKIFDLFKAERGKQFDPKLIDIFFEHLDEFLAIRESLK